MVAAHLLPSLCPPSCLPQVLLAYGAQSVAVEEYRPDGAHEQV